MHEENRIEAFYEGITSIAVGKEVLYSAEELGRRLLFSPIILRREIEDLKPGTKVHFSRTMLQALNKGTSSDNLNDDISGWFLTEGGANRLIMASDSPEASDLRDWLFEKVLPSVVRTGEYEGVPISKPPSIF